MPEDTDDDHDEANAAAHVQRPLPSPAQHASQPNDTAAAAVQPHYPSSRFVPHAAADPTDTCVFCRLTPATCTVLALAPHTLSVLDARPVTRGHALVIPRRHVRSITQLAATECAALFLAARALASALSAATREDDDNGGGGDGGDDNGPVCGFNIGVNDGACAGQRVAHAHVHVIPRRDGDGFWCTRAPWDMERARRATDAARCRRHRL